MRGTKIVATLGPATDDPKILEKMVRAGVDVVRLNYSHQTHAEHSQRVSQLRLLIHKLEKEVGMIADLQGPKIRIERFQGGSVYLQDGDEFVLDTELDPDDGDENHVGVTYKDLPRDVKRGDTLLIDDGRIILKVEKVVNPCIECVVLLGGRLSDNKGLNREGGGLSAKALTPKDRDDIRHAVQVGADYIAVSFPRNAEDIHSARRLIEKAGGQCGIIAKIERTEALDNIDEITEASDGIMIARGDLGVEIGDAALPPVQKRLIDLARNKNRLVITATQMMESMIQNLLPTRAEVFDVANAVLDGTDAVMLSAETAIGQFPEKTVEAMARICAETEVSAGAEGADYRIEQQVERVDEAIALSAVYAADHIGAKAIAALTETGATCMWMSRVRAAVPIFAFTRNSPTCRRVTLCRGVYPVNYDVTHTDFFAANKEMIDHLVQRKMVKDGDVVVITKGDLSGAQGGTNGLKILRVGQLATHSG